MKNLDQSKYSIEEVYESQKASDAVERFVHDFHEDLIQKLNQKDLFWIARTHKFGITYMCNDKKSFMSINIYQKFVSSRFFTGNRIIEGLIKANWMRKGDNQGSEIYRIVDDYTLDKAVNFAIKAYEIAVDWTK